jgi:hypothetical protein
MRFDSFTVTTFEGENYSPVSIQLQGSNDGSEWTNHQLWTGLLLWPAHEVKIFALSVLFDYLFARFVFTKPSSRYIEVGELRLRLAGIDLGITLTANDAPSPYVASASSIFASGIYPAWKAFDGNPEPYNMWASQDNVVETPWLQLYAPSPPLGPGLGIWVGL